MKIGAKARNKITTIYIHYKYLLNTDVDNMIIIDKVMEFIMMRFKQKKIIACSSSSSFTKLLRMLYAQ